MNALLNVPAFLQEQDVFFSFYTKDYDDLLVSGFAVEETIFGLTRIEVMPVSDNAQVDLGRMIDEPATLTVHHKYQTLPRHFSGIVAEAESGDSGHRRTAYRVVILPALYRLDNGSDCRIYQSQTVPEIIAAVLNAYDIQNVSWKIASQHQKREFLVCYNETALAFNERLMAEEGIFYFFNHDEKGGLELVITDQPCDTPDCGGQASLPYNALASGVKKAPYSWSVRRRHRLKATSFAQRDRTFKNPQARLAHCGKASHTAVKKSYELYRYPGRYKQDAVGEPFAKIRLEAARVDASLIEGVANSPLLVAGHKFALTDHPDQRVNTWWRLLTLRHEGTQPQVWREDGAGATLKRPMLTPPPLPGSDLAGSAFGIRRSASAGLLRPPCARGFEPGALGEEQTQNAATYVCAFAAQEAATPYRPPQMHKPLIDGPQIAQVVGPPGEEIYTDEHGHVKVRFPWDRHHDEQAEDASCWIRVASTWAGATWGAIAIPRIGQEVIVEFLDSDPDQPIITGRTYNAGNRSPYPLPANKTRMVIRSDTHKGEGYNELRFEDENGREEVFVHAQRDMNCVIENDETRHVGKDRATQIVGNENKKIARSYSEQVLHSYTLLTGGNMLVSVGSVESIPNFQQNFRNADKTPQLMKKSLPFALFSDADNGKGGGNYHLNIKAGYRLYVGESVTAKVTDDFSIEAGKDTSIMAGKFCHMSGEQHVEIFGQEETFVEAGQKLNLVCGRSSIVLHADGRVFVNGTQIYLN